MAIKGTNLITVAKKEKKSLLEKYGIPLNNLSYEYITECTNATMLEHIIMILRSGEEGSYPNLTRYAEERLIIIKPNSLILLKALPILTRKMLDKQEQNILNNDMNNWTNEMRHREQILDDGKATLINDSSLLPDIRSVPNISSKNTNEKYDAGKKPKRIASCDYVAWDKYDVETEMNRIDLQEERQQIETKEMQRKQNEKEQKMKEPLTITDIINSQLTIPEIDMIVDQERIKGNESFRIGDYNKALKYYDFCFGVKLCTRALNNRAITYVKLHRYEDAIKDDDVLIFEDNTNVDAFYRRGYCFVKLGKLEQALADYEKVLELKPDWSEIIRKKIEEIKNLIELKKLKNQIKEETLSDEHTNITDSSLIPDIKSAPNILSNDKNEKYDADEKSNSIATDDSLLLDKNVVNIETKHVDLQEKKKIKVEKIQGSQNGEEKGNGEEPLEINNFAKSQLTVPQIDMIVEQARIKGNKCFRTGDYNKALKYYDFCFATNSCLRALHNRAITYIRLQRYEDAIKDYNAVILENNTNAEALYRRGYCFVKLGKLEEALANYKRLLVLKPNWKGIISTTKKLKKIMQSKKIKIQIKEETLSDGHANITDSSLIPDIKSAPNILSNDKNEKYDADEKSNSIATDDSLLLDKNDVNIETKHVDLQEEKKIKVEKIQGSQNGEEKEIMEPLEINNFAKSQLTVSQIDVIVEQERIKGNECFRTADYNKALKYYNFCFATNSCLRALNNRAITYIRLQRYEDAIKDYNVAIFKDNTNVEALVRRGYCFIKLGKLEQAIADYEKVLELKPNWNKIIYAVEKLKHLAELRKKKVKKQIKEETLSDGHANITDSSLIPDIKLAPSILSNDTNEKYDADQKSNSIVSDDSVFLDKYDIDVEEKGIYLEKKKILTMHLQRKKKPGKPKNKIIELSDTLNAELTVPEIDMFVNQARMIGNEFYKIREYNKALKYYNFCFATNFCLRALNNRAMTYIKLCHFEYAIKDCNIVISEDNTNRKALYRRAFSLEHLGKINEALADYERLLILEPSCNGTIVAIKKLRKSLESKKLRIQIEEETFPNARAKINREEVNTEKINLLEKNFSTIANHNLKNNINNSIVCFCERGPGPSHSIKPLPHTKDDYCIRKESNEILPSSSETHYNLRNINLTLLDKTTSNESSIPNSQESKNNKQNKQKSIFSYSMVNTSGVDIEETLNDQSHITEPNSFVKVDNGRINNNTNNNNNNNNNNYNNNNNNSNNSENENESNSIPKRISVDSKYSDDQMCLKKNNIFTNIDDISNPYKFTHLWQSLKNRGHDLQLHAQLLRSIKCENLITVISNKLDGNMLSLILRCLEKYFCKSEDCELLVCYLKSVSQLNRFFIVKYFLDKNDKKVLSNIFQFLEGQGCKEVSLLHEIYT